MSSFKKDQSLNEYVLMFEEIYEPIQNVERDFNQILARLLEAIAECSQYVNKHKQEGLADNLPKVFSWYCSLVHKSEIKDLDKAVWKKFPKCCPYCLFSPCRCSTGKKSLSDNSSALKEKAAHTEYKPKTLYEWQKMFSELYPRDPQGYDQKSNFSHLIEELGEASEAYRIRYFQPTALESELADIFTWILGMANLLNSHAIDNSIPNYNSYNFEEQVFKRYPGICPTCKKHPCSCVLNHSKQKISELNVIYPEQILEILSKSMEITISDSIKKIATFPELQNILAELRKLTDMSNLNNQKVEALIKQIIQEPEPKNWYKKITAEGIAESSIVSMLTLLLQSAF